MKGRIAFAFILFILASRQTFGCTQATDTIFASQLKPIGRTVINSQHNLELITSAAHFGFSFKGTECTVYASISAAGQHNYPQKSWKQLKK